MANAVSIYVKTVLDTDYKESEVNVNSVVSQIQSYISKNPVKIPISVDSTSYTKQAAAAAKSINTTIQKALNSITTPEISVAVSEKNLQQLTKALKEVGVGESAIANLNSQFAEMGLTVDKVTANMTSGAGEASQGIRNLESAVVVATDELGNTVTQTVKLVEETQQFEVVSTTITQNYKELRTEAEKTAAAEEKANAQRQKALSEYGSELASLYSSYTGQTSSKGITDTSHLESLRSKYIEIATAIQTAKNETGTLSDSTKANIEKMISQLKQLVSQYRNLEYVATTLRTKTVEQVKSEQLIDLDSYEKDLRNAGILTESFYDTINGEGGLRSQLTNAFDSTSLTQYLNNFDSLKAKVDSFKSDVQLLTGYLNELAGLNTDLANAQVKLNSMTYGTEEYNQQLQVIERIKTNIGEVQTKIQQSGVATTEVTNAAMQASNYTQKLQENVEKVQMSEAKAADSAADMANKFESVGSTINNLRSRYENLTSYTDSLNKNYSEMNALFEKLSSSKDHTTAEWQADFQKLQDLIPQVRSEIVTLNNTANADLRAEKFVTDLEKAKASLQTVAKNWSALFQNADLTSSYNKLASELNNIENPQQLKLWNAELNTFKAQVKAAGANTMTFTDQVKKNIEAFTSWFSAIQVFYSVVRTLKSAIETVIDLDTAMVDLKKTTDATTEEYQEFYAAANDTAKALGVTTEEVISMTAEWSRLGYTLEEAADLAEISSIFASISPDMDTDTAVEGLVSILKAFDQFDDIDTEDVLDAIVSKVNAVGNSFALSNDDVVTALENSSAAMNAANNSFEETVALATAAIEVTQDASTVGNALKTVSMRIRGYDEDTEEFDEDIYELTGDIADLTKVASNGFTGVSLFTDSTKETYRSTYEILEDIANIWDELSDTNQAELLQVLFGKTRAQVGASILSNFESASEALQVMEDSAGGAEAEMEIIYESIEYQLNALQETWTGVAQSLFQSDDISLVISWLQSLSDAVATVTDKLGLFGSAGVVGFTAGLAKIVSTANSAVSKIQSTTSALSSVTFDTTSSTSLMKYVDAFSKLTTAQQNAVAASLNLDDSQVSLINSLIKCTAATESMTIAELESVLGMEAGTIADGQAVKSGDNVTAAKLRELVASGQLTQAQMEEIVSKYSLVAANEVAGDSYVTLGTKIKASIATITASPAAMVSAAVMAISAVISIVSLVKSYVEETEESLDDLVSNYEDAASEVESLESELEDVQSQIEELNSLDSLTVVEQQQLEALEEENVLLQQQLELRQLIADQAQEEVNNAIEDEFETATFDNYLRKEYSPIDNSTITKQSTETDLQTYIEDYTAAYKELLDLQESGVELTEEQENSMEAIKSALTSDDILGTLLDWQEEYTGTELADVLQYLIDLIQSTVDVESYIESAISGMHTDIYTGLSSIVANGGLTETNIEYFTSRYSDFREMMELTGYSAEEMAEFLNDLLYSEQEVAEETDGVFEGTLTDLSELIDDVSTGLDILEAAKEEMESEGHISVDTIADLAGYDEDNYLEYLYEEDGQLKINTADFQEYVQAKMLDEIADYQDSIDSLKEETEAIEEQIDVLKASNEELDESSDEYKENEDALAELESQQESNNEAIEEAEKTLAIYQAAYDNLTETVEESTNAFKTVEDYTTYLSDLWDSEDLDDIKEDIEDIIDATGELNANDVEDLCDSSEELAKMLELDGMNAEFLAEVLEQLSKGNDGLALITEEALALNEALDGMESQFSTVTEAIEKYNSALEASEKDEDFQTYSEAYTTMIESFESGQINSNAFWASAELLFGTDQLKEWEWSADVIYEKLQSLENAFSDDESAGAGFLQTLYEMAEAGELVDEAGNALLEISKTGTGSYEFSIDYENIDDIAEKMGISEDAAIACLKALSMWGEVDFYNIEEVLQTMSDIGLSTEVGDYQVIGVEELEEQLENLGKTSKEIYDIEQALEALDNVVLLNVTGETSDLIETLKTLGIATDDDTSLTVDVDYSSLEELLASLGYVQEQADDTLESLEELEDVSFSNVSEGLSEVADAAESTASDATGSSADDAATSVDTLNESVETLEETVEDIDNLTLDNITGEFNDLEEAVDDANTKALTLYRNVKKLDNYDVEINVSYNVDSSELTESLPTTEETPTQQTLATGTTHATAGPALTGEEGPELVQSDGYAYLVGTDGPEVTTLHEGDVVYTAEETKKIFKSGKGIRGVIPSFDGGGVYSSTMNTTTNKTGSTGTTEWSLESTVDVDADTSDAEDELEDLCEELQDALDEILDDYEHNIFMLEKANAPVEEIVAIYKAMQEQVHAYAEQYRALGLDENDDYIQELQEQWWEYEEEIRDAIAEAYENARSEMENYISLRENWLSNIEYLDANNSDAAIFNVESVSDYENISKNIIAEYRELQENLHEEAEYYRSLGYSETSDEISDLSDAWWDYEEEIREVSENINDYLESIVDTASEMLDDISNAYDTLHDAADTYAETGYITVDTLQSIIELGPEYMQYLTDENGLLVINEESINKVIAAMTQQLALEQALTYIERLHLAATGESSESLDELCYNTQETTDSTWGLVYAELALMNQLGELTDEQYEAALHNVEILEELANATVDSIGTTTSSYSDELEEMQDGLDDIIKYVMDMLEDRINDQIDALEDLKDAYSDLIELRKEALEAAEDEADYEEEVADLVQEIADIEAQISLLSLDDSREAAAERAELEEELAELQEELADTQADYALDAQIDALDDMEEAYEEEKDAEIATLEETISSYEKLYQMAIAYIEENWDTLYDELLEWNYEQGDVLNETIIEAWNAAYAAAVKYGDYVSALAGVEEEIESTTSGTSLTVASTSGTTTTSTAEDNVVAIVKQMYDKSTQWASSSESKRETLHAEAVYLAGLLTQYGVTAAYDSSAGTWTITSDSINPSNVGKLLYEAYLSSYHSGGIVGADGLKEDEELAILKYNEWVLTEDMVENLKSQMANIEALADAFSGSTIATSTLLPDSLSGNTENVTNNSQPVEITIGDTIIQGSADSSTVAQHIEVTRDMVDQIARILKLKL